MSALLEPFEPLRAAGTVRHSVQTNATLIDDRWCDLLNGYGFSVGVSIDGPPGLNARRADRAGRPAHDRILAGIGRLREHGIVFSLIAVVGTDGIGRAEDLLDFLAARSLDRLGNYLRTIRAGERAAWEAHRFDPLPTIAYNGDVVLLSPELAGITDARYGDFIAGNVLEQPLPAILARAWQLRYVTEFTRGLAACRRSCGYFDFCRVSRQELVI